MSESKTDSTLDAFVRLFGASHALFVEGDQDTDDAWEVFVEGREDAVCGLNVHRVGDYRQRRDTFNAWAMERGEEWCMVHSQTEHPTRHAALAEALVMATKEGWLHPPVLQS